MWTFAAVASVSLFGFLAFYAIYRVEVKPHVDSANRIRFR